MPEHLRAYYERAKGQSAESGPIRFVASTESVGRDGLIVEAAGWQLENYRKNPVVLWAHDYGGRTLPIGRAEVEVAGKRLMANVTFDPADEFARSIERKYRDGFLNAVSVGWESLEIQPAKNPDVRGTITRAELLDISAVPVPGDPNALQERQKRALADYGRELLSLIDLPPDGAVDRAAIPPHSTDRAPEDAAWDAGAAVTAAEGRDQLRRIHAWVNEGADPESKSAYKLPHHNADGQVVWRGVAAAMSRLMQAGTQIPDADRRGVYSHLARHYQQFDREPPEFRTNAELAPLEPRELRGLFLEGEPDLFPDLFPEERAGAVLSKRNKDDLARIRDLADGMLRRASSGDGEDDDAEAERALRLIRTAYKAVEVTHR